MSRRAPKLVKSDGLFSGNGIFPRQEGWTQPLAARKSGPNDYTIFATVAIAVNTSLRPMPSRIDTVFGGQNRRRPGDPRDEERRAGALGDNVPSPDDARAIFSRTRSIRPRKSRTLVPDRRNPPAIRTALVHERVPEKSAAGSAKSSSRSSRTSAQRTVPISTPS